MPLGHSKKTLAQAKQAQAMKIKNAAKNIDCFNFNIFQLFVKNKLCSQRFPIPFSVTTFLNKKQQVEKYLVSP